MVGEVLVFVFIWVLGSLGVRLRAVRSQGTFHQYSCAVGAASCFLRKILFELFGVHFFSASFIGGG